MSGRLTPAQARQVRSLVEDGGWSKAEARTLVLMGMGEYVAPVGAQPPVRVSQ